MITPTPLRAQRDSWQRELSQAIHDPAILLERLELPSTLLASASSGANLFPLRVTEHYLGLIEKGNPDDPLLRQVLPLDAENKQVPGFNADPVSDHLARQGPGLLKKYSGRVLVITTGACAIHCRYCFRREYPYAEENATRQWAKIPEHVAAMPDVSEVILSGGDPLTLSDRKLQELLAGLNQNPELKRLRIHSRIPSVLPSRITPQLIDIFENTRLHTSLVLHCNHARELDTPLDTALAALRRIGVTLLNQSVLLKGVNDSADTLAELSERLFEYGVLPYYLHALDPVSGAAHFKIPDQEAKRLHRQLRHRLPGYLVPRLVREIPERLSKTPLQ